MPEPRELTQTDGQPLNNISRALMESEVIEAIRMVFDPEIPVNVFDLGLIYGVNVNADRTVDITMTLTSPACPVAEILPGQVETAARSVSGVGEVTVELVWDPPYTIDRIPEHIRLELGFF